ncbi:MAG: M61 family peptidase, partial [Cyclobacteriaceae bacterium]|nr:M61 family peptidase [Cyclobacteriaceae bacterium]
AFTSSQMALFGGFPAKDYHFIFHILPYKHYHGVEHANSTVITLGPDSELSSTLYEGFIHVSSHELFHAWNVCRIKPREFAPYDFSKESFFDIGFMLEGITTYYGDLMLFRSGVLTDEKYFESLHKLFARHFNNPGRHHYSLAEASHDLWLDGYKTGAPDRTVSIYVKGALVALMLDLTIRKQTENAFSLDDFMTDLWARYGKKERGYTMKDLMNTVEKLIGNSSMTEFFNKYIFGTVLLEEELGHLLKSIGCTLMTSKNKNISEGTLGFLTRKEDNREIISSIAPGSPAETHLATCDQIIEIIGMDNPIRPSIKIHVTRDGTSKFVDIHKGDKSYFPLYTIKRSAEISPREATAFELWAGKK